MSGLFEVGDVRALIKERTTMPPIRKKALPGKPVAVYDENGKLVGIVDASELKPIADASGAAKPVTAPADPATADAAADIAKALQRASWRLVPADKPVSFAKAAGTIAQRYDTLIGLVDKPTADVVNTNVATLSMRFGAARNLTGAQAVDLAKAVALDVAVAQRRR